ncbi:MAG: hypothetical protein WC889_17195 [Myxococcota bacterium]
MKRTHIVAVLFLVPVLIMGCSDREEAAPPSLTGLFISDIHFNPLLDRKLADTLNQAPASQWDSIFAQSTQTECAIYPLDTNFALLQSALVAMKLQVPSPDVIFISGDLLVHDFQQLVYNKVVTNPTQAGYEAFVYNTEQYLAIKLTAAFPNAQILPTLGDWDTAGGSTATYADSNFLSSFATSWKAAVNRNGGAPDFQTTFSSGGYYSTKFPVDPKGRLIGLYTQPWAAECTETGTLAADELQWLTAQLADARSKKEKVWLLGHIPPGIDANTTADNLSKGGTCQAAVTSFWAPAYASQLYALFTEYRDVLAFGIFAHEHYDDMRVVQDSSGKLIFSVKLPPSITPMHNNPAFTSFTYNPNAGVITDTATWYLNNLASKPTTTSAVWAQEYTFNATYGQTAFDSKGVAGAVAGILTKPGAQLSYTNFYPSLYPPGNILPGGMVPFLAWSCGLNNITVADYTTCYCGNN